MKFFTVLFALILFAGCATTKDVKNLQTQINDLSAKQTVLKTELEQVVKNIEGINMYSLKMAIVMHNIESRMNTFDEKLNRVFTKTNTK